MSRTLTIVGLWALVAVFSLCLVFSDARAGDLGLFALDEVSVHYKNFFDGGRNPYFWDSEPKEEINYQMNFTVLKHAFVNTKLHSMTNDAQYHLAGLNLVAGVRVTDWLDFQYEHFSKHVLDDKYPHQKFGVEDSWGIKIYLYKAPEVPRARPGVF